MPVTSEGVLGLCFHASFDHLVGTREQCGWKREPQCLCGHQVDHELKFGRSLHGKITSRFSIENSMGIQCRPSKQVRHVDAVRDQTSASYKVIVLIDRRHPKMRRELDDFCAVYHQKNIGWNNEPCT